MRALTTSFPALRHRDFTLLWFGQLLSFSGSRMQTAAILWHVSLLAAPGRKGIALGLVGAAQVVPIIVFGMLSGVVADALDRRRVMLVTQSVMTLLAATLATLTFRQLHTLWPIYLLAALSSAASSFDAPARQALIPNLVPREDLASAIGLNTLVFQIASVAGPTLAGLVIASAGIAWVYAVNAVSFVMVIAALLVMRARPRPTVEGQITWAAAWEGLRFVFAQPIVRSTMLLDFIATFFASATALLPIFAQDVLHVGARGFGWLYAAPSVGAVAAGVVTAHSIDRMQRRGAILLWAVTAYGAATVVFGLSTSFWLTLLCLVCVGAADTVSTVIRNIIRQLETPDELRGRMTGVNMIFFMGGPQLGEFEAGLVAQVLGPAFSVVSGGVACLFATGLVASREPRLRRYRSAAAAVVLLALSGVVPRVAAAQKPRVVVTTDPELDDANSLIRFLLYSTDFRTEGLIYASSQFHWKGDGSGKKVSVPNREYSRWGLNLCPCESYRWAPNERFIDLAVDTYTQVYPNLRVHDARYPTPAELRSKVRWGNVAFDGDISQDSPGSDLIKSLLLDDEPGPLYLLAWGGQSTIARALKAIEEQYSTTPAWPAIKQKISRKAILSTSGDQDDTYATYIKPNWPDIRILPAGGAGAVALGYGAQSSASVENAAYYSAEWTRRNVSSRGALGALYRVWGDGKQMVPGDIFDYFGESGLSAPQLKAQGYIVWTPPLPQGEFLGEGDSFTFLNLVDNGLRGAWGGGVQSGAAFGFPPLHSYDELLSLMERAAAAPRPPSPDPNFTPAAQNDFAARLRWSVTPRYAGANHEPRVTIRGASQISAHPGQTIQLRGEVSDPDGNAVKVRWWQWREAGSYPGRVTIANPTAHSASLQVPGDARAGQTIEVVLEASDDGTPPLTRYQRVSISISMP